MLQAVAIGAAALGGADRRGDRAAGDHFTGALGRYPVGSDQTHQALPAHGGSPGGVLVRSAGRSAGRPAARSAVVRRQWSAVRVDASISLRPTSMRSTSATE